MSYALITGASSGIGLEMAKILNYLGYKLILVARREERLKELNEEIGADSVIIPVDLSDTDNCIELYERVKDLDVSVLINNAGFGLFGNFTETDLDKELQMINVNIKSVHTLTKLFLKDFVKKDEGYILNVASSAGLMAGGPLMATYYATKSYVVNLTRAINEELHSNCSNVYIGALCPGPVDTEFNKVAGVNFALKSITPKYCAKYAMHEMFDNRKMIIVPSGQMKISTIAAKFLPTKPLLNITRTMQEKKFDNN